MDESKETPLNDGDKSRKFRIAKYGALIVGALGTLLFAASITLKAWVGIEHFVTFNQWTWFILINFGIALGIYSPTNVFEKVKLAQIMQLGKPKT